MYIYKNTCLLDISGKYLHGKEAKSKIPIFFIISINLEEASLSKQKIHFVIRGDLLLKTMVIKVAISFFPQK